MDCRKRKSIFLKVIHVTHCMFKCPAQMQKILFVSPWKASEMNKLTEVKSPVKIQKLMCHEDGTPLINEYTMVQPMKPYEFASSLRNLIIFWSQQSLLFLLKFQVYSMCT